MARVARRPGRPAGAVLRPEPARPRGDGRRRRATASATSCAGTGFRVREETADGRHALPLRRPPPVHEAGDAAHPPRADPVPRRGGGHVAASATSRASSSSRASSLTVQPIGTPGLLLVKNLGFEAPGFETGQARDFTTELAVYRNGQEIARKTIRVNDPLSVGGYTFHQNGFGPAPDLVWRRRRRGRSGTARCRYDGWPACPTDRSSCRAATSASSSCSAATPTASAMVIVLPYRVIGTDADGNPIAEHLPGRRPARRATRRCRRTSTCVGLTGFGRVHAAHRQEGPGQGIVWAAFVCLITGITITFYLPRRRVWARLGADGRLGDRLAVGPLRRRRARVRAAARRPRRRPPAGPTRVATGRRENRRRRHNGRPDGPVLNRNPVNW